MDKETIEFGNKLIAEFMGGTFKLTHSIPNEETARVNDGIYSVDELNYHESWDWLMPVIEKIEKLKVENIYVKFVISSENCGIFGGFKFTYSTNDRNKLQTMWNATVEFIKWHNK